MIESREQILEYFTRHNYDFLPGKDPNTFKPFPHAKILDLGTNLGMVAAYWALNGAHVTSYEADPETYKLATEMFDRTNLKVNVINKAIWSHSGTIGFKGVGHMDGDRLCRNGQMDSSSEAVQVPCITLTEALGDTIWDCVKIDIEGAEFEVLMSTDSKVLENIKYMNLEIHEQKHHPDWLIPEQVEQLRGKLEKQFEIRPSIYSSNHWHLFNARLSNPQSR